MQFLNKRYFFNELIDTTEMLLTSGVISHAYMINSSNLNQFYIIFYLFFEAKDKDWLIEKFKCNDKNKFRIYNRKLMPKRYHYSKTERIGDLIFEGMPGVTFYP